MSYVDHELKTPEPMQGVIVGFESDVNDKERLYSPARYRLVIEFDYDAQSVEFNQYLKQLTRRRKRGDRRFHASGMPYVILSVPKDKP
jgi:hypothetical protein